MTIKSSKTKQHSVEISNLPKERIALHARELGTPQCFQSVHWHCHNPNESSLQLLLFLYPAGRLLEELGPFPGHLHW